MTSSPRRRPSVLRASSSASVPLAQAMACRVRHSSASRSSSADFGTHDEVLALDHAQHRRITASRIGLVLRDQIQQRVRSRPKSLAKRPRLGRSRPLARARSKTTVSAKPRKLSAPEAGQSAQGRLRIRVGRPADRARRPALSSRSRSSALAHPPAATGSRPSARRPGRRSSSHAPRPTKLYSPGSRRRRSWRLAPMELPRRAARGIRSSGT